MGNQVQKSSTPHHDMALRVFYSAEANKNLSLLVSGIVRKKYVFLARVGDGCS